MLSLFARTCRLPHSVVFLDWPELCCTILPDSCDRVSTSSLDEPLRTWYPLKSCMGAPVYNNLSFVQVSRCIFQPEYFGSRASYNGPCLQPPRMALLGQSRPHKT